MALFELLINIFSNAEQEALSNLYWSIRPLFVLLLGLSVTIGAIVSVALARIEYSASEAKEQVIVISPATKDQRKIALLTMAIMTVLCLISTWFIVAGVFFQVEP